MLLLLLLFLGKQYADLAGEWVWILGLLAWGCALENGWLAIRYGSHWRWSWSLCSTAIGLVLMLYASHPWIYYVALTAGWAQKHWIRCCDRHGFNPSNFALIVTLMVFGDEAGLIAGQLGESFWLFGVVIVAAVTVLVRARRWIIPLVFVPTYLWTQALWVVGYDPTFYLWDVVMRFESVSFVVFVVFMLTDPRTTPTHSGLQALLGVLIATAATLLDRWLGFRVVHLFAVLFVVTPWTVWIETHTTVRPKALRFSMVAFFLSNGALKVS
jgi:hypothetical protein